MNYYKHLALTILFSFMLVGVPVVTLLAIWSDSTNMEETAAAWFFIGGLGGGGGLLALGEYDREPRAKRLSREARSTLRKRKDEIRLQVAIEKAEEEAGVYVRR